MQPLLILIIAVLMFICKPSPALSEEIPEINPMKGVFLYEGFQHWINLTYDFTDSKTGQGTYYGNSFKEGYNASLQLALFDPHVFDAILQGSFVLDQSSNSNDSLLKSNLSSWQPFKKPVPPFDTFQYNFSGSGLDKSRIPFTLLSFRTINTTQNTFAPPTKNDNLGNEFDISFLNSKLRSRFHYTYNSIDTLVDRTTSSSVSNSYTYTADHNYGTLSSTSLSASFSDQNGGSTSGDKLTSSANSLGISNTLSFGEIQNFSLASSFQLTNTMIDSSPTRSLNFSESFGAALGRALFLNAGYSLTKSSNSGRGAPDQENVQNRGEISVKHKLFESLHTELRGIVDLNNKNDGTEKKYSVQGNVTYNKNLSPGNSFFLGISKAYDLVDRNVSSATTVVRDELHAGVRQGDVITLELSGGALGSVTSVSSRNPIFTYVEGVDYSVNYPLGRITILSGGGVRIDMDGFGTDLYITYALNKDPNIKYSTDSLSLSSGLTLFDAKVILGASWSNSGQAVISGPATNTLKDSRSLMLYVNGKHDNFSGRLSYRYQVSGDLIYQTYESNITNSWQTLSSTTSLTANNNYSLYDATLSSDAYWENNADVALSYRRNILANTTLMLQCEARDFRSKLRPAKDGISLRVTSQTVLNKIIINMSGQTAWLLDTNGTTRNDTLHIDIIRYF